MYSCAKVDINSAISSSFIFDISWCNSKLAFILVTSAFFRNSDISLFIFWSWYSMILVLFKNCYSSSVFDVLCCKKVADNWLNTLVFWPINMPVSMFFFLPFIFPPFYIQSIKELIIMILFFHDIYVKNK